jgi:hypothetical protein
MTLIGPASKRAVRFLASMLMCGALAVQNGRAAGSAFLQGDQPLDEAGYWQLVQRSRELIAGLKEKPQQEAREELSRLAGDWEAVRVLRAGDGRLIPIDHAHLVNGLRADPPRLEEIGRLLEALQAMHAAYPQGKFTAGELDPLREILERPEFAWTEPRPNLISDWFGRLVERFNKWLGSLFGEGPIELSVDLSLLPLIAALLMAVILLVVARTLFADFVREARAPAEEGGGDELLSSRSAFDKAQALSRGGDFRSAVRYLYLSSLLVLDERGLLRYDRTKTNREYLRSISHAPALAGQLREVVEVFDEVWYGYHSLGEESFKHYSDRVQELKEKEG